MRIHVLRGLVLLVAVGLAGCSSSTDVAPDPPPDSPPPPPPPPARLGDQTDVHLADWLQKPRPELAKLVEEWSDVVRKQKQHAAENPLSLDLLPRLQPPGTMPVFGRAAYSDKAGFSLPPYLQGGERDAAVALHLARLGDREAALKLADPANKDLLGRINGQRTDRNYPLEWTQLAALAFQSAEWKVASGQTQGATDLMLMHKQLRTLLDERAAAGPLGAALLPLGRRALVEAAAAWKKAPADTQLLAQDIDAALKDWGDAPPPAPALVPGSSDVEAVRLFGRPAAGRAVVADKPEAVARALDLLELPVPSDGVLAVAAFLDADRTVTETLVLYRSRIIQTFPEAVNLASRLVDHGLSGDDPIKGVGLTRIGYTGDELKYEVALLNRGDAVGAFVRIGGAKARAAAPLPDAARDYGAVHLDRTFEQNRVLFARNQTGSVVELDYRKSPGVLRLPAGLAAPDGARLEGENALNLTSSLTLDWPADAAATAVTDVVSPLLAAYGAPHIDGVQDPDGDALALVWEDARTRLTLRLPYESNPVVFRAENRPGSEAADARVQGAVAFDLAQRKARLDAGKPAAWLPRYLQLPEVRLGMTLKQVRDSLPPRDSIEQHKLGGDLTLIFKEDPPADATYGVRQMFLRFGADERLVEIRARYQEGPAKPDEHHKSLLGALKAACGEPLSLPAPWAGLWPDLPPQSPKPALYRWTDDITVLTLQRDGGGAEAILRDWPAGLTQEQVGDALKPLTFCDEGAAGLKLGMTRAEVSAKFPVSRPVDNEDAVAVAAPADSAYESLAVWFDAGKAARVVAQHRAVPTDAADVTAKLNAAWQRDVDQLGARRRLDGPSGPVLQAYGWHDDRVRVRIIAQQTADGPRLFTEWRYWPADRR